MSTGTAELPPITEYHLVDKVGERVIHAHLLGHASSWKPTKLRWFEVSLYKTAAGEYVVHTLGKSKVEGDVTRARIADTSSSWDVMELLTVTHRGETYIPRDSLRALAQAAQWDIDLRARYLEVSQP